MADHSIAGTIRGVSSPARRQASPTAGRGLEEVEARLIAREERRLDMADCYAILRQLACGGASPPAKAAGILRLRASNVGLDEVGRHAAPSGLEEPAGGRLLQLPLLC